MVEAWGRGFDKIAKACGVDHMPDYEISESGVMVVCQSVLPLEDRVLKFAAERGEFQTHDVVESFGLTEKQAFRLIKRLCDSGAISAVGENKGRTYHLNAVM